MDGAVESATNIYLRHAQSIVTEAVKDLSGGIMPSKKRLGKILSYQPFTNGVLYKYQGRPMVFIAHPKWRKAGGKIMMDVQHKKLYRQEPQQPTVATN